MHSTAFLLPLVVLAVSCSKAPSSLIPTVDRHRSALLHYYELNHHFPERLGDIDPQLEFHRVFHDGGWAYFGRGDSYRLVTNTSRFFKEGIWFDFDPSSKDRSGWVLSRDGFPDRKLSEFEFSKSEKEFFENRTSKKK
jgi:hypothetical protein